MSDDNETDVLAELLAQTEVSSSLLGMGQVSRVGVTGGNDDEGESFCRGRRATTPIDRSKE